MRVVVDTNVLVSALIFGGQMENVRAAWQAERFVPLISKATATEFIRVLAYPKFKLSPSDQEALLADYVPYCEAVTMPELLPATPNCRDPFDVPFLVLALVGKADYLVTGDRDLLALKADFACPVLTCEEFLSVIENQTL